LIPFGDPSVTSLGFDPKLPDYQIGNLRLGVRDEQWEVAAFINNIWDEQALLSLDTERGRSARIGYLTNTPRSYGLSVRRSF
jgi:iron complex outermembrane receptor protein